MLKTVLSAIANALFGFVFYRVKLWWTNRQLAQAQAAHQLAVQKFDSLQTGVRTEGVIQVAGTEVVTAANSVKTWQEQLAELQKRAEARAQETKP